MKKYYVIIGLLLSIILLFSIQCAFAQSITTINGVNTVTSPPEGTWGDNSKIEIEFFDHLGFMESDNDNYLFYLPKDIVADNEDNLYILDLGNTRIQKFNKDYSYELTIGRKGQGPGELLDPRCIDVDSDNKIYVSDPSNAKIQIYSSEGNHFNTIKIHATNINFRILDNNIIILRNPNLGSGNKLSSNNVPLFSVIDMEGKITSKIGQGIFFTKYPESTGGNRLLFTVDEKFIYNIFLFQNSIEKYNYNGEHIFDSIRPARNYRQKTGIDNRPRSTNPEGIDIDSKGRIWILSKRREEKPEERISVRALWSGGSGTSYSIKGNTELIKCDIYELELYSNDGVFLTRIPLNHFCDGIRIIDDRIYIVDKLRTMRFYIYNIIEK